MRPRPPPARATRAVDISGLVVHATPGTAHRLTEALGAIAGVTVHAASPEGKLVVTVEAPDTGSSAELFERIRAHADVAAVSLAYHRIETEPDEELRP